MPRPWTGNTPLHARLTARDIDILEGEKARRGLPSLSAALEQAIERLIEDTDAGRKGLIILPTGEKIIDRKYFLSPGTHERLDTMTRSVGFNLQQILRAAIAKLDQDRQHQP